MEIGAAIVCEGTSYLPPLGGLVCCLLLLPMVGQWSERVQGVATPGGVVSISVGGDCSHTG
jgi:hypothetical protein